MIKKILILVLFFIFCLVEFGEAQDHRLDLNISSGVLLKTYAYPLATVGVGYKYKFLETRLSYTKSFLTHGRKRVIWDVFYPNEEIVPRYWRYEYRDLSTLELVLLANVKIGDFIGYVGGGIHWQHKPYSLGKDYFGAMAYMGYKLNQLDFSLTIYSTPFQNELRPLFKIGYNIPLIKGADKNYELEIWKLRREKKEIQFSIVFGGQYKIPISKKYPTTGATALATLNYYLREKYRFFFTIDLGGTEYGADSDNFAISWFNNRYRILTQFARIQSTGRLSLGCTRILKLKQNIDFDYGAGFSLNCRGGCDIFNRFNRYIPRSSLGVVAQSQLRIGPFTSGIELNIPLWKLPPTLSFYWAIGINFRKKGRKLNAYDQVPQY